MKWWFEKKRNQPRISPWNCHSSPRKMDGWKTFSSPGFRPIFWGGELLVLGKGIRFSSFSDQPFDSEQKNIQTKGTLIVWTEFSPFPLYFKESKVKELLELPRLKKKHGTPPPQISYGACKTVDFWRCCSFSKEEPLSDVSAVKSLPPFLCRADSQKLGGRWVYWNHPP